MKDVAAFISSAVDGALQSSSMIVNFANSDLQGLFHPPYHRREQDELYYDVLITSVLTILHCLPFLLTFCYVDVKFSMNAKIQKQKNND